MTVNEVKDALHGTYLCGEEHGETEVHSACGSDMMSDVLAFLKDQAVLLTGLCNPQVIVRGKMPDQNMIEMAREKGLPIISTRHRMFSACGLLYEKGLRGGASD